jgi:hypothetical protein
VKDDTQVDEVTSENSSECIPFDATAATNDLQPLVEGKSKETVEDVVTAATEENLAPTDLPENEAQDPICAPVENSKIDESVQSNLDAADSPDESSTKVITTTNSDKSVLPIDAVPTSPVSNAQSTNGFMSSFFSRMSERLFCKTDDYLGDFSTICGGTVPVASPTAAMETNTPLQIEQTIQAPIESPSATNAVEVKPIFDEPEDSKSIIDEAASPRVPVDPVTTSLETTPSIDLQSSSLGSTKTSKSLTLITEVKSPPSTESFKNTTTPVNSTSPSDANVVADEVVTDPGAVTGSSKSISKKRDLRINTSFFKKSNQTPDADDNVNKEEHKFNLARSMKAGLKSLSPRGADGFKGFRRSQAKSQGEECQSPKKVAASKPVRPDPDLEGIRIYGGGVTVPVDDKTQYPKFALDYKRKKGGLAGLKKHVNRHFSHVRETAMSMNKVLQQTIVTASQPKVKAIMTNHVHSREQANRLYGTE